MTKISIIAGCYNEVENIPLLYARCRAVLAKFPEYDYEFVLEDNCSTDGTRDVQRKIAAEDPKFKVILNANNFGPIRSPFNALLNGSGDAVVWMCSDLQEPPEIIEDFIHKWQEGYKVVCGVRSGTNASHIMEFFRKIYYAILKKVSGKGAVIPKFTGFGLYDRCVVDALKKYKISEPFLRGLVAEIGFRRTEVYFVQQERIHGHSTHSFFMLYSISMNGIINNSKIPLRLAIFQGSLIGVVCIIISFVYLVQKLCYWDTFQLGSAPMIIGIFFFAAIQLFFIGIIGEYIGAIWTQVRHAPQVIEEERINFSAEEGKTEK